VPLQNLLDYIEGQRDPRRISRDFPAASREMAIAALERAKFLLVSTHG
jgi:hypothetical protein